MWGRWVSADVVFDGRSLVGANLWAYCWNNPVRFVDHDGRKPMPPNNGPDSLAYTMYYLARYIDQFIQNDNIRLADGLYDYYIQGVAALSGGYVNANGDIDYPVDKNGNYIIKPNAANLLLAFVQKINQGVGTLIVTVNKFANEYGRVLYPNELWHFLDSGVMGAFLDERLLFILAESPQRVGQFLDLPNYEKLLNLLQGSAQIGLVAFGVIITTLNPIIGAGLDIEIAGLEFGKGVDAGKTRDMLSKMNTEFEEFARKIGLDKSLIFSWSNYLQRFVK
jgi:hypothetical protein